MQAHQAAMDEKVAEVANLTLRLREMSGKLMWHESRQEEVDAKLEANRKRTGDADAGLGDVQGVSPSSDHMQTLKLGRGWEN